MVQNPITFLELARQVLLKEKKPLKIDEIWDAAQAAGLLTQLVTTGKTPKHTLGARLYMDVKSTSSLFEKIGARPATFTLKSLLTNASKEDLEKQLPALSSVTAQSFSFSERDLHPLLVSFARGNFEAHCKTIFHDQSKKGQSTISGSTLILLDLH